MNFVQNILWNSVEGFVEAGTRTAGGYAGDALIKAGDLIENSGRSMGTGIERRASNYGTKISGQGYEPSPKALPSTARKPAIKRSVSSPASSKPGTKAIGPGSKALIGANKYLGGKALSGASMKQITSGVSGAKSTAANAVSTGQKNATSVAGGGQKAISGIGGVVKGGTKTLPKAFPNNVPYGTSTTSQSGKSKAPTSLPKPYSSTASQTTAEKKTAVKPGQSKPFKPPEPQGGKRDEKKPYPGTNTLPGQASRTPVKPQKYKPMERLGAQVDKGQKMAHIAV